MKTMCRLICIIMFGMAVTATFFSSTALAWGKKTSADSAKKEDVALNQELTTGGTKYEIGYSVITISAPGRNGQKTDIDVAIWYPTSDKSAAYTYDYGDNKVATLLAFGGKPTAGHFPLVIYAHGGTGCGLSSAFLTERLAHEGFVVAAPDFPDEYTSCRTRISNQPHLGLLYKLGMTKWIKDLNTDMFRKGKPYRPNLAYRPRITSALIDKLLGDNKDPKSPFYGSIDENQIGMVGHSFGGWTSIIMAGADSDYKDSRVKGIVSLSSPVHEDVYTPSELANIHIPVMFMYGQEEAKDRKGRDQRAYDQISAPKCLLEIAEASHFTFSGGVKKEFPNMSEYTAKDPGRATIVGYTALFFQYYLKNDAEAGKLLNKKSGAVTVYINNLSIK